MGYFFALKQDVSGYSNGHFVLFPVQHKREYWMWQAHIIVLDSWLQSKNEPIHSSDNYLIVAMISRRHLSAISLCVV